MTRAIFNTDNIHSAVHSDMGGTPAHRETVDAVIAAVAAHPVVIVGMRQNPEVKKARKILEEQGTAYYYLEYGSYMSEWRRRLAIKMWLGWPTFPMVFIHGVFIGGHSDLARLQNAGALDSLLKPQR